MKSNGAPPIVTDFAKSSRNYQYSKNLNIPGMADSDNVAAKVEGNIIYDSTGYMPREVMLKETLNVFGQSVDMFEVIAFSINIPSFLVSVITFVTILSYMIKLDFVNNILNIVNNSDQKMLI